MALTKKQKKLPMALQKAILKKQKQTKRNNSPSNVNKSNTSKPIKQNKPKTKKTILKHCFWHRIQPPAVNKNNKKSKKTQKTCCEVFLTKAMEPRNHGHNWHQFVR